MASEKIRLDELLLEKNLADRIEIARSMILAGSVLVNDRVETKVGVSYPREVSIRIRSKVKEYVSRGAYKLLGAFESFPKATPRDKVCVDLGASTGGFTQVLLEKSAKKILSVDVGYGQLIEKIRKDQRVIVLDRFHFKNLTWNHINEPPTDLFITADLSFISIKSVFTLLSSLHSQAKDYEIEALLLVKPQFEVDSETLEKGILKDRRIAISVLKSIIRYAIKETGAKFIGASDSKLEGMDGNREFFIYLKWVD
ncbi:TlyA family RNA methyltransferase [Leptospira sp. GIMC2001]|uniref:TlyA family RNA methyltransferase n=1 Tax=Leptospira sp. GIMC2001 TaxID=1513297 RepID=UPI00234BA5EB|nr:TlyA family RNA methyltransferase [Leptospira sp. GIMC2001]WCL49818.1 TlyA family RNA methyltransferase [Leptospira sp. GIMC2001]